MTSHDDSPSAQSSPQPRRRRRRRKRKQPNQSNQAKQQGQQSQQGQQQQRQQRQQQQTSQNQQNRRPKNHVASPAEAPYVAVAIQTSGIHPTTARLVAIGAATFDAQGNEIDYWHTTLRIDEDPGPAHLHGLTSADLANSPRMGRILAKLNRVISGRILLVHNAPFSWGFIAHEADKARRQAKKNNRNRRGNNRARQRNQLPKLTPELVVDTCATGYRQGRHFSDTRLRAVAGLYGASDQPAVAGSARKQEAARTADDVRLIANLFRAQGGFATEAADVAGISAELHNNTQFSSHTLVELNADQVGLQVPQALLDATKAPRLIENPGVYQPGSQLVTGMEFSVAEQTEIPPEELVNQAVAAGLTYTPKVTRELSLLVCNQPVTVTPEELTGKAMHASRKNIPIVSDQAFLRLLREMTS